MGGSHSVMLHVRSVISRYVIFVFIVFLSVLRGTVEFLIIINTNMIYFCATIYVQRKYCAVLR